MAYLANGSVSRNFTGSSGMGLKGLLINTTNNATILRSAFESPLWWAGITHGTDGGGPTLLGDFNLKYGSWSGNYTCSNGNICNIREIAKGNWTHTTIYDHSVALPYENENIIMQGQFRYSHGYPEINEIISGMIYQNRK